MKFHRARSLSRTGTVCRFAGDGSLVVWPVESVPVRMTSSGYEVLDCYMLFAEQHDQDWIPLTPTPIGIRKIGSLSTKVDLIDRLLSVVATVEVGRPDRLQVAARRVLGGL